MDAASSTSANMEYNVYSVFIVYLCIGEEKECKKPLLHTDIRSTVTTIYDPQYKITNFKSKIEGKGRVSIIMYLPSEIWDSEGQGKMRMKVVDEGKYL